MDDVSIVERTRRQSVGELAQAAKLSEREVREIKAAPNTGPRRQSNYTLGRKYGVSDQTISRIRRGVTWRHVT